MDIPNNVLELISELENAKQSESLSKQEKRMCARSARIIKELYEPSKESELDCIGIR